MLDLRRLRCFAAVAETLHFGRAAQRLHMAQPPLTRQISALEEELGFRLFDRSSRAVTLTAEGSLFLPYARALLDQLERTAGFARKLAQGLAGHLTLGYASSIALSDLFTEAIRLFRERHPEVQLELLEGASAAQWAQIAEGGIDVGLGRLPPPEGQVGIEVLALGGEPLVVAVPNGDPLARQERIDLYDLRDRPLILFPLDYGSGLNELIERLYRKAGLALTRGPAGRQITSIIALVAAGQGVALVPRCSTALARAGVVYRPLAEPEALADFLVFTRRHGRSAAVEAFLAILGGLDAGETPDTFSRAGSQARFLIIRAYVPLTRLFFMQASKALLAALALGITGLAQAADEVVVYSSRIDELIKPVFDAYTSKTGVKVKFITDKEAPLMARIKAEGANTPADLLLTVDAGNLWQAEQMGLLQPFKSATIERNIPSQYRSSTDSWTGLSLRARTIVYSTERVKPEELSTYEALADKQWEGRLCLRTAKKVYNQSLTGTLIETHGAQKTEEILQGWVNNLATDVFADDNAVIQAVDAGQCDVGIVNTYYYGRLHKQNPNLRVKLFWPNQADRGVHVNLSGIGLTRHAPHPEAAKALVEWMTGPDAQALFAGINQEFPANPQVAPSAEVASWGSFKADSIPVEVAGKRQAEAIRLMDRAGWN
ncbi:HTH-type transcriptional regulator HdfR [Pseudomonas aeruginosa]